MKRTFKKGLFFLEVPIYEREIAVFVGLNQREALTEAKKQKCTKSFIETLETDPETIEFLNAPPVGGLEREGAARRINENRYFLFLKPFRNDWEYYDTLAHECFHLTQFIGEPLQIWSDIEPPAYLYTFIFKTLRRKLSGNTV